MLKLDIEKVDALFNEQAHQEDVVVGLYKMVYPEWNNIAQVDGFPEVSEETGKYLFKKFTQFDRKHHPEVFNGGLWLNNGFSDIHKKNLKFMEVIPCKITLKNGVVK